MSNALDTVSQRIQSRDILAGIAIVGLLAIVLYLGKYAIDQFADIQKDVTNRRIETTVEHTEAIKSLKAAIDGSNEAARLEHAQSMQLTQKLDDSMNRTGDIILRLLDK